MRPLLKRLLDWFNDAPQCQHRWRVLLEHYPSYAYDWWTCDLCGEDLQCTHDEAPIKIETEICNWGHIHIVNGKGVR